MADFEPYSQWLGIDKSIVPPNYYQLLGINPGDCDEQHVKQAASQLTSKVRAIRPGTNAAAWTRILDEIEQARKTLSDQKLREKYDRTVSMPSLAKKSLLESKSDRPADANEGTDAQTEEVPEFVPVGVDKIESSEMLPPSKRANKEKTKSNPVELITGQQPSKAPLKMAVPIAAAEITAEDDCPAPPPASSMDEGEAPVKNEIQIAQRKRRSGSPLMLSALGLIAIAAAVGGIYFVMQQLANRSGDGDLAQNQSDVDESNKNKSTSNVGPNGNGDNDATTNQSNLPVNPLIGSGDEDNETNGNVSNQSDENDHANEKNDQMNNGNETVDNQDATDVDHEKVDDEQSKNDSNEDKEDWLIDKNDPVIKPAVTEGDRQKLMMLYRRVRKALARRDPDLALRILEQARTVPATEENEQIISRLEEAIELSEQFWTLLADYLPDLRGGDSFTFGNNVVGIVESSPNFLTIRQAGRNRRYYPDDIPSTLAIAVIDSAEDPNGPDWKVVKAIYYWTMAEDRPELMGRARQFLSQAIGRTETKNVERLFNDRFTPANASQRIAVETGTNELEQLQSAMLDEYAIDSLSDMDIIRAGTFAQMFLDRSFASENDQQRFASVMLAKDCAIKSNDLYLALDCIDELERRFEIDRGEQVVDAFERAASNVRSDQQARRMFMEYINFNDGENKLDDSNLAELKQVCLRVAKGRNIAGWIEYLER